MLRLQIQNDYRP